MKKEYTLFERKDENIDQISHDFEKAKQRYIDRLHDLNQRLQSLNESKRTNSKVNTVNEVIKLVSEFSI